MRLKTILAKNMQDGMRRVREQLGDDAVIVQTEETEGGVLIMAAAEQRQPAMPPVDRITVDRPVPAVDPADNLTGGDPSEIIADALDFHRVPASLLTRLVAAVDGGDADEPLIALADALRSQFAFDGIAQVDQPILLIGPAGSGKTVTAAKLATAAAMSGCTPVLVCADADRAGGAEQLRTFATALKAEMLTARSGAELRAAIRAAGQRRPVIIDTPALNSVDAADLKSVRDLVTAAGAEPLLALSASLDAAEAADIAAACAKLGAKRFIATGLDSTRRLGAVLSAAGTGLAIAGFGVSRKLVGGLRPADGDGLARAILNGAAKGLASHRQTHRRTP